MEVIDTFANWRLPLDKLDLRMVVKDYLDGKNEKDSKFKDNFPGVDWANGFVKRHNLTQRFGDRVKVTIHDYFAYLTVLFSKFEFSIIKQKNKLKIIFGC